jgi:hypothetical protein
MPAALFPLILAAIGAGCSAASTDSENRVLTTKDVIENIDELNGKAVRVAGYLGECAGYECNLFLNPQGQETWKEHIAAIIQRRQESLPPEPPMLGIGVGKAFEFDRQAAPYTNSYVVITGKVTNRCRYRGQPACTDRSTDLEPTEIEAWQPDGQAAEPVAGSQ